MRELLALSLVVLASPALAAGACDPAAWNGTWDSEYGLVWLEARDRAVTGSYEYLDGVIGGTLDPGACTLSGQWVQSDDDYGTFRLTIDPEAGEWSGTWESLANGASGEWNGTRALGPRYRA